MTKSLRTGKFFKRQMIIWLVIILLSILLEGRLIEMMGFNDMFLNYSCSGACPAWIGTVGGVITKWLGWIRLVLITTSVIYAVVFVIKTASIKFRKNKKTDA